MPSLRVKVSPFNKLAILAAICLGLLLLVETLFEDGGGNTEPTPSRYSAPTESEPPSATSQRQKQGKKLAVDSQVQESRARGEEMITSVISDSLVINQKVGGEFFPGEWKVVYPVDGDTVYSLSKREGVPLGTLMQTNGFTPRTQFSTDEPVIIFVGDKIESTSPLEDIATAEGIPLEILREYNGKPRNGDVVILPKTRESQSILRFHFLSPFSKRLFQSPGGNATKILASGYLAMESTSAKASADGLVIFEGVMEYYGRTVILKHPMNYFTVYSNLESSSPKQGKMLHQEQEIGKVEGVFYFQLRQGIVPMDLRSILPGLNI